MGLVAEDGCSWFIILHSGCVIPLGNGGIVCIRGASRVR